jgi:aspartyl-tRNA(Asn)/glutamyl-tRNA(Gln) amidotransferase subunit C
MGLIKEEDIAHLSRLCRIKCTPEELQQLAANLAKIVAYVEQLQEIDTSNIDPLSHVLEDMSFFMRDDVIGDVLPREQFLENAPDKISGLVRFPPVLKTN